jgi:hypothetical protein
MSSVPSDTVVITLQAFGQEPLPVIQTFLFVLLSTPAKLLTRWSDMIDDGWDQHDPYLD